MSNISLTKEEIVEFTSRNLTNSEKTHELKTTFLWSEWLSRFGMEAHQKHKFVFRDDSEDSEYARDYIIKWEPVVTFSSSSYHIKQVFIGIVLDECGVGNARLKGFDANIGRELGGIKWKQ